jgi:hypothetical protein
MNELEKALADIADIRSRVAAGTLFQGFGPAVLGASGLLAFAGAGAQTFWPSLAKTPEAYLAVWTGIAVIAAALIGTGTIGRSRRHHGRLSSVMIVKAIEHFLPSGFAGAAIAAVLLKFAPQNVWMLPGLWQILVALGIFAASRSLPPAVIIPAGWYFVSGTAMLIEASAEQALTPWMMGLPFGAGQLLVAGVLHFSGAANDG